MKNNSNIDIVAKNRYTDLRKSNQILPISNQIKRDKLIIDGSVRQTFNQDNAPFCIWRDDYDPNLNPMSWESIQARRAKFDPLMDGGNNNENKPFKMNGLKL